MKTIDSGCFNSCTSRLLLQIKLCVSATMHFIDVSMALKLFLFVSLNRRDRIPCSHGIVWFCRLSTRTKISLPSTHANFLCSLTEFFIFFACLLNYFWSWSLAWNIAKLRDRLISFFPFHMLSSSKYYYLHNSLFRIIASLFSDYPSMHAFALEASLLWNTY